MKWIDYDSQTTKLLQTVDDLDNPPHKLTFLYPCDTTLECSPHEVKLQPGIYKFELWGSQGGNARYTNSGTKADQSGGRGAYVSGVVLFKKQTKLFLYIGAKGEDQSSTAAQVVSHGGYNGGGDGGMDLYDSSSPESSAAGGGSTDIRLVDDTSNTIESLKSRIIVAGAGAGACSVFGESGDCTYTTDIDPESDLLCTQQTGEITFCAYGGAAGALHGYRTTTMSSPGTQSTGWFGFGEKGLSLSLISGTSLDGSSGGCGSGYFGGTTTSKYPSDKVVSAGGAGGSSYVSGCEGCRSILKDTATNETSDNPVHYSGIFFTNIEMVTGIEQMISPSGTSEIGHTGSGAIAITFIHQYLCSCKRESHKFVNFLIASLLSASIASS